MLCLWPTLFTHSNANFSITLPTNIVTPNFIETDMCEYYCHDSTIAGSYFYFPLFCLPHKLPLMYITVDFSGSLFALNPLWCYMNRKIEQCSALNKSKWVTKLFLLITKLGNITYNVTYSICWQSEKLEESQWLKGIERITISSYPCPSCVTIFNWKSTELRLRCFHLRTSGQLPATYGWNQEVYIRRAIHVHTHTVKPPFIIWAHCFSTLIFHVFWSPNNRPYKECIIILDALLLQVSFSCVNPSEFMVLTHNIPETIVSEKKQWK